MKKFLTITFAIIWILMSTGISSAQESVGKLEWIQAGNCWVAQPGFLYCSQLHPYVEDNPHPFLTFACFEHYQAVLLGHETISDPTSIRTVHTDFGNAQFSDVWIAASENETFMSNNVDPGNDGYVNILRGLGSSQATQFKYSISPGDITGEIELTGEEHNNVWTYIDLCNAQTGQ